MGIAIILQYFFYKPPSFQQLHGGKRTLMQEVKRIDFVGIFLLVAGLAMFLLGVSWGQFQNVTARTYANLQKVAHHCHGPLGEFLVSLLQAVLS